MTVTAASGFRADVAAALSEGWQARSLYAAADSQSVRIALTAPDGRTRIETVTVGPDGAVPSIADLAPAMGWDEREAHDLHGITFTGHEPMRPLASHAAPLADWTVPVRGHDPYQVAVGPVHAGVIESGHFRFHVVGDRILHLDARLFYKHRGLERAAEGMALGPALAVVSRACAACAVANGVAFATAAEQALGLRPAPQLARARTLLLELERVWNHLNDIAAVCAGVGMAAGNAWFLALTERARRLNASVTGHRFLFGSVQVGGSTLALDADAAGRCASELAGLRAAAETGWRELAFNASFQDRLGGVGVADARACARLGVTGPAARAAGLAEDAHTASPYPGYDGFRPVTPVTAAGDVRDRLGQRMLELRQAFGLLDALLDQGPVSPATAVAGDAARPAGIGLTESPRGATSCVIERAGEAVRRVRLRTASYANWPAVSHAAAGSLLPDFPLINKSFELLRLRGPLMLTMLRDLRRLRRGLALPRPDRARSLAIRHVDAGSCNGCEHELTIASGPHYDLQRYGLGVVASPRHADVLLVTGIVTTQMREPLLTAYHAMPEPRKVAALGNCALGCNVIGTAESLAGAVSDILPVDLLIPGCPPAPGQIARALLNLIDGDPPAG